MKEVDFEKIKKDLEAGKLTPEQVEQLQTVYKQVVNESVRIFEKLWEVIHPVMKKITEIYESLPEEMKKELAAMQVEEDLKKANIEALPDKEKWIAKRLEDYAKFWSDEKKAYVIDDDPNDPDPTIMTRDELIADLKRSYDEEHA